MTQSKPLSLRSKTALNLSRYEFRMQGPPALTDTAGIDPKLLESLGKALSRLAGVHGQATVTSRCLHKGLSMDAGDEADPVMQRMVRSMRDSMERMSLPFPGEPVGSGARWKALERIDKDGMTIYQIGTFTIERFDGPDLILAVALEQAGTGESVRVPGVPPAIKMQLVRMNSNGRGDSVVTPGAMFPRASLSMDTEMVMNARAQEMISQTALSVHIYVQVAPGSAK